MKTYLIDYRNSKGDLCTRAVTADTEYEACYLVHWLEWKQNGDKSCTMLMTSNTLRVEVENVRN